MTKRPVVGQTGARFGSPAMRRRWQQEAAEEQNEESAAPAVEESTADDESTAPADALQPDEDASIVGQTGARFGSPAMRRRWRKEAENEHEVPSSPEPDIVAEQADVSWPAGKVPLDHDEPEWDYTESSALLVRPYARTGGRTRSSYDLPLETLVSATQHVGALSMRPTPPEWLTIAEMCAQPRSVAEVAASLAVPIGVARVMISDMAADGSVVVHSTASAAWGHPDQALLERILHGLRRL